MVEVHASEHIHEDELTAEKAQIELYDDYDVRTFGLDRYRTEGMYDSIDRLDASLKMLMERRIYSASRLEQREAGSALRWG